MSVRSMEFLISTPLGLLGVSRTAVVFRVAYDPLGRHIASDAGYAIPWWIAWPRTVVARSGVDGIQAHVTNVLRAGPDAHPIRFTVEGDAGRQGRWTQTVERRAETASWPAVVNVRDEPVGGTATLRIGPKPARMVRFTVAGANSAQRIDHLRVVFVIIEGGDSD